MLLKRILIATTALLLISPVFAVDEDQNAPPSDSEGNIGMVPTEITIPCLTDDGLKTFMSGQHMKYMFSSVSPLGFMILFGDDSEDRKWVLTVLAQDRSKICILGVGDHYKSIWDAPPKPKGEKVGD